MIELEHHECSVMLGCTYDVLVETTDRIYRQKYKYTVPGNYHNFLIIPHSVCCKPMKYNVSLNLCVSSDCLNDVCSCKHASVLPSPFVNGTVVAKMLNIYWKINESLENVSLSSVYIRYLVLIIFFQFIQLISLFNWL